MHIVKLSKVNVPYSSRKNWQIWQIECLSSIFLPPIFEAILIVIKGIWFYLENNLPNSSPEVNDSPIFPPPHNCAIGARYIYTKHETLKESLFLIATGRIDHWASV